MKEDVLIEIEKIAQRSKLTEKDADEIIRKIKKDIAKNHGLK